MTNQDLHHDITSGAAPSQSEDAPVTPRARRGGLLWTGAGLLGGALVGLTLTVPTFIDAAGDGTEVPVEADVDNSAPGAVDRAGTRLRSSLQELVDAGTITAEQADAVADHLVARMPDRGERGRHRGSRPGFDGEVVAELIGVDVAELRAALRAGQSIADIADANGVDVQTVIDALVEEAATHLDLAVENGRLTEAEADAKLADLGERIAARVNGERRR